jgi:NADH-quinone oxidoreductase subunit J
VHSLLYLIVSMLALSLIFFVLGAQFVAALQVTIYSGAIMVLFVFVIMMLNQGPASVEQERQWLSAGMWVGPTYLALVLAVMLVFILTGDKANLPGTRAVDPKEVGLALYGPYAVAVELASLLLIAGLVGAYHIGRPDPKKKDLDR